MRDTTTGASDTEHVASPVRSGVRLLAVNVGSILTGNAVNRANSLIVYALVASFLGARALGQLALAMALFQLASSFALMGLDTLISREVARNRGQTAKYVANAGALVLVSSLFSCFAVWIFVELIGYPSDTSRVVLFLFLGLVPFALSQLLEAVFIGWELAKYVAFSSSPVWIGQAVIVLVLLTAGHGVEIVVLSIASVHFLIALIRWLLLLRRITRPPMRADWRFMVAMSRESAPFLGIQATGALHARINVVLLSAFTTEATVGIYSAAQQLLVPTNLVFESIALAVFPVMVRRVKSGVAGLRRFSIRLIELTMAVAVPTVAGVFVLAESILLLIYRDPAFTGSVIVLRIMIWTTIQTALTAILGQVLWATRREGAAFRLGLVSTIVQVVLAFFLISQYDEVGAATATLVVAFLTVGLHYFLVTQHFGTFNLFRGAWKPVVAAAAMTGVLTVTSSLSIWVKIPLGATVYLSVLLLVHVMGEALKHSE